MASRNVACVLGIAFVSIAGQAGGAFAQPKGKAVPEAAQAAQAIERALQKHGVDVHRCFEKALADRLDAAGKVRRPDKAAPAALVACIEKAALGWTVEGIEPGAAVVLPFVFKQQQSQYLVNAADVPEHALGGGAGKGKPGPRRDAPFTVKVLADQTNVKAENLSLTLLSVGPASRVAMHRHPHSAKILYLVKGHARLLGPEGVAPIKLEEGSAVYVPAGYPHVIENMGRQSTGVFLQAFSPPGPERVYRDPTDVRGRAEFEVIRDVAKAKAPAANVAMVVASPADAKPVPLAGVDGTTKTLIDANAGHGMRLGVIELSDGADWVGKGDATATEVLYVVAGGGSLKVSGEALPLATESTIYLPHGTAYAIKAAAAEKGEKVVLVSIKVPATGGPRVVAPPSGAAHK